MENVATSVVVPILKSAESSTFIDDTATISWYETYRVKFVCVAENVTTKALSCCKLSVVSRRSTNSMPSHSSQLRFRSKFMLDAPILLRFHKEFKFLFDVGDLFSNAEREEAIR